MELEVEVRGQREFRAKLRQFENGLADLKETGKEAAEPIAAEARANIPVRSGKAAATIRTFATATKAGVRAGFKRVPYIGPLHFGHRPRRQGGYMTPQPFLYDALDGRRREVLAAYEKRITTLKRRYEI